MQKLSMFENDLNITNPRKFRGSNLKELFSVDPNGEFRILSETGKRVMNEMALDSSKLDKITPNNSAAETVFQGYSGRLLIPEAIRFNTTPLIAAWSKDPMISSRAHVFRFSNPQKTEGLEKALCAWLNSSFVISYLRSLFTTLEENFGHIYGWHLRALPIPELRNDAVTKNLASVFDRYSVATWPSLPEQYESVLNNVDKKRLEYDLDVVEAIAKPYDQVVDRANLYSGISKAYKELLRLFM